MVGVRAPVATGANADGHREILGLQVTSAEDGVFWTSFLRSLKAGGADRGPAGDLRCAPEAGGADRRRPARCGLAEVSDSLRGELDGGLPEDPLNLGALPAALR